MTKQVSISENEVRNSTIAYRDTDKSGRRLHKDISKSLNTVGAGMFHLA